MEKHYPGPWLVAENGTEDKYKYSILANYGSKAIADIYRHNYPKGKTNKDKTGLANANLIAAAPDLLEALIQVKKALETISSFGATKPFIDMANTAIEKATNTVINNPLK